jgi:hypothetical protein
MLEDVNYDLAGVPDHSFIIGVQRLSFAAICSYSPGTMFRWYISIKGRHVQPRTSEIQSGF